MGYKSETVELTVPRNTYYLAFIRKVTSDLARKGGFVDEALSQIEMAIDEACANAILYQNTGPNQALCLKVELSREDFRITLRDRGAPFDFDALGLFDIKQQNETANPGGLGIYIIKNFMDEVSYEHLEGVGNVLRMVKLRRQTAVISHC
jgi:anti-sigma regulatory factor (Ser/Thr protein kinase)